MIMYRRTRTGKRVIQRMDRKSTIDVLDLSKYPLCLRCAKKQPIVKPSTKPTTKPTSGVLKPDADSIQEPWWIIGDIAPHDRVYAFDLDWTIIKPKSGNVFPKGVDDWTWWNRNVPSKITDLNGQIVIVTNQRGLRKAKSKTTPVEFLDKMRSITNALEVPILWLVALDDYHKPSLKLWQEAVGRGLIKDSADVTYIGDAGGRPKGWRKSKKADFSISDLHFAHCLGAKFMFPEEFFMDDDLSEYHLRDLFGVTELPDVSQSRMVVMIGSPGSTKSTISRLLSKKYGHVHLEQDVLKRKVKKQAIALLDAGESVIIDATHRNNKARQVWIDLAKKLSLKITFVWVKTEKALSSYLNSTRKNSVPMIAIHTYYKHFEEPETALVVLPKLGCID